MQRLGRPHARRVGASSFPAAHFVARAPGPFQLSTLRFFWLWPWCLFVDGRLRSIGRPRMPESSAWQPWLIVLGVTPPRVTPGAWLLQSPPPSPEVFSASLFRSLGFQFSFSSLRLRRGSRGRLSAIRPGERGNIFGEFAAPGELSPFSFALLAATLPFLLLFMATTVNTLANPYQSAGLALLLGLLLLVLLGLNQKYFRSIRLACSRSVRPACSTTAWHFAHFKRKTRTFQFFGI